MLIEFSVGNFRSFHKQQTVSMVAAKLKAKDKSLDKSNVIQIPNNPSLLASAAIYGANASGKSNLILALRFMRSFVLNSTKETRAKGAIEVEGFRLSTEMAGEPSFFEIVFVESGDRYRYGFEVTTEQVETEWLYVVPTTREARLFERERDNIVIGPRFREGREIVGHTRPNALFLSVAAQLNGPIALKLVNWFRELGIASGLSDRGMQQFTLSKLIKGEYVTEITQLVRDLDLGIGDLKVETGPHPIPTIPDDAPAKYREVFSALTALLDEQNAERVTVRTSHMGFDAAGQPAGEVLLDMEEHESEGTRKLFSMSGPLIKALKRGEVLIVDELDARLHPLLTKKIVKLFNSKESNPFGAQLIFTTQDTNLLDNTLFRRDQVWFVEKDQQGSSHLYSLAEFRVRSDKSFERGYIQGRFGAIPYLSNLQTVVGDVRV